LSHPPADPHDPIEEIAPNLYMVRGSIPLNAMMSITRNMAIVRHEGELTLVNPLRLDADEERQLEKLGAVKRLLRLGPMHGLDDPYYLERYAAELWAPGESELYPEPKPHVVFDASTPLPFPDAEVFCFEKTSLREAALLVRRDGGVLLTCDGIQHYGDYRYCSFLARLMMPFIGFPRTTIVGPMWLKLFTPPGESLEPDFRRLLERDFDHLLSAHGSFLRGGAHAAVERAVEKAFSE
jgi:hypothetical protein